MSSVMTRLSSGGHFGAGRTGTLVVSSMVNTEEKKLFKILAFAISSEHKCPSSFLRSSMPGFVFILEFVYFQNTLGLDFNSDDIFRSNSTLSFLVRALS